jgi:hypothetical protein
MCNQWEIDLEVGAFLEEIGYKKQISAQNENK